MDVSHTGDIILTIVVLSFWFLFPIGMFLSVARLDKLTDQVEQLEKMRLSQKTKVKKIARTESGPRRSGRILAH